MEGRTGSLYGRLNKSSTRGFLAYTAAGAACAAVLACFVLSAADSPASAARNDGERLRLSSRSPRVWPVSCSLLCRLLYCARFACLPCPCVPDAVLTSSIGIGMVFPPRSLSPSPRTSRSTGGWWSPPSSGSSVPRLAPSAASAEAGSSCPCSTSSSASTPNPPPRSPNVSYWPLPVHASADLLPDTRPDAMHASADLLPDTRACSPGSVWAQA
jgi:hypothetical protein